MRARRGLTPLQVCERAYLPATDVVIPEDASRIRAALEMLPEEQKQTLELAFYDGYTNLDISKLLNASLDTVRSRIQVALAE